MNEFNNSTLESKTSINCFNPDSRVEDKKIDFSSNSFDFDVDSKAEVLNKCDNPNLNYLADVERGREMTFTEAVMLIQTSKNVKVFSVIVKPVLLFLKQDYEVMI